jgi:hypothetical protein
MSEYSITNLLEALSEDDIEKKIIKLLSEGHIDDELLEKLLSTLEMKK